MTKKTTITGDDDDVDTTDQVAVASPRQVIKDLSFHKTVSRDDAEDNNNDKNPFRDDDDDDDNEKTTFLPIAPPPSAPPPPPPPPPATTTAPPANTYQQQAYPSSYQHATTTTSTTTTGSTTSKYGQYPIITNYSLGEGYVVDHGSGLQQQDNNNTVIDGQNVVYGGTTTLGDANIRPNTGQTNDVYGGIGSLTEIVTMLRWCTIITCIITIVWEGFALPTRFLIYSWIYPSKVILGIYLGFFALLLLGVEINVPLKDNFGILYYPLGRSLLLLLMSGMCIGILTSWWEILLGFSFACCSIGYFYTYMKYPEYRKWQDYNDNTIWKDVQSVIGTTASNSIRSWATPFKKDKTTGGGTTEERQSLLV